MKKFLTLQGKLLHALVHSKKKFLEIQSSYPLSDHQFIILTLYMLLF